MSNWLRDLLRTGASATAAGGSVESPAAAKKLRICNAPPGYPQFVGLKHAQRWIKQGNAELIMGVLSLRPSFRQALARSLKPAHLLEGAGYDQVRRTMTEAEKRNLPMVRPRRRSSTESR